MLCNNPKASNHNSLLNLLNELTMVLVILPRKPQISKSTIYLCYVIKYSTRVGRVSWQIQHSASPRAIFAIQPLPSYCILSYSTHNGALGNVIHHFFLHSLFRSLACRDIFNCNVVDFCSFVYTNRC